MAGTVRVYGMENPVTGDRHLTVAEDESKTLKALGWEARNDKTSTERHS